MELLIWLAISFMVTGCVVLLTVKKRLEGSTVRARLWFVAATTVWGVVSILLVPWLFGRL